jgi:hypothetical protein
VNRYERTQIGWVVICVVCIVVVLVAIKATAESSQARQISFVVEALLLFTLAAFYKLTIKIDQAALRISFGVGLIRKQVKLAAVAECEPIRIRWWYGWGIHLTPYGWLYNVSGLDAVAIKLHYGRKFVIGTDDPQGLAEAIRRFASAR